MLKTALLTATLAALSLTAAPQEARDAQGIDVHTGGLKILHRTGVAYPAEARAKGISGDVVAAVTLDAQGEVTDAKIVSGPAELRGAVLRSVLRWHFALDPSANVSQPVEVAVRFNAPTGRGPEARPIVPPNNDFTVDRIDLSSLPPALQAKVEAAMPVRVGELVARDRFPEIERALRTVDSHLLLHSSFRGDKGDMRATLAVSVDNGSDLNDVAALRVGGNEQASKLVQKVVPKYPAEAKAARIQGVVRMDATIAKDGTIRNLKLISGPPELVQSAMDAVKQWVYRPTLLNGDPVDVITQIDVNYTLAQ